MTRHHDPAGPTDPSDPLPPAPAPAAAAGHPPPLTIRLRGPADVVATLPYHLGYQPTSSLVTVGLRGRPRPRVGFVARVDLPPVGDLWATVDHVGPLLLAQRPESVVLVGYEDEPGRAEPLSRAVRQVLEDAGVGITERLVVRDGRYYGLDCSDDCCPPDGTPVPDAEGVPAVADYVLLGRTPLSHRDQLAAVVTPSETASGLDLVVALGRRFQDAADGTPPPGRHLHAVEDQALRRWALQGWATLTQEWSADGADCWSPDLPAPRPRAGAVDGRGPRRPRWRSTSLGILLAASLRDVGLRDLVITWLCPGSLDLDRLDPGLVALARHVLPEPPDSPMDDAVLAARLAALCRATPAAVAAPPLTVVANLAWWHGDGALARTALEVALEHEPDYRLATLLQRMLDLAIPPRRAA